MTGSRRGRGGLAHLTAVLAAVAAATACGASSGSAGRVAASGQSASAHAAAPLAPVTDYQAAVTLALADHLTVWIEADMVKRWQEGPTWFGAAVGRVAALADRPGVAGIKIADELGYRDGMDSPATIRRFLTQAAAALHAAAPGKLLLVDMVVPELGCVPGHQAGQAGPAGCEAAAQARYPQLSLTAIDSYLRPGAIDVLDLSTGLQADATYQSWGTTADAAQAAAWREVNRRGWSALVRLQARKALAGPGGFHGSGAQAAADVREFVGIPLAEGARAVDIWTWHQEYDGQMYALMDPGMHTNALWSALERLRQAGDILFTHMSPHSVQSSLRGDLAEISTVFTDVFLPAGTG